jgi:hypothetical protein
MHSVHSVHDCEKIMEKGWKNRATGATLMNADSSRIHMKNFNFTTNRLCNFLYIFFFL